MSNEALEMSLKANCMRILEILDVYSLSELKKTTWFTHKPEAIELKQRMAQLRKDTIKAEKIIYPRD